LQLRRRNAPLGFAMRRPGTVTRSFTTTAVRPGLQRMPTPAVATTSAPTPAYRQHHDVTAPQVDSTAFRQSWRVATRLNSLLEPGRIDREAWDCATEWRRWAETVTSSRAQPWDIRVDISAGPTDARMLFRVHAATKLREAAAARFFRSSTRHRGHCSRYSTRCSTRR
jgi:hypothetical protein